MREEEEEREGDGVDRERERESLITSRQPAHEPIDGQGHGQESEQPSGMGGAFEDDTVVRRH